MIRRFAFAALFLGAIACGDDGEKDDNKNKDASTTPDSSTGGNDAGGVALTPDKVTNVGTACNDATSCSGGTPICQKMLSLGLPGADAGATPQGITNPGGYCTATCQGNAECGTGGECPVAESIKASPLGSQLGALSGALPSYCYKTCTSDADCRTGEGYKCDTIANAVTPLLPPLPGGLSISTLLQGPFTTSKYCLPPPPPMPDGGAADAGATDAGAADAAATDAAATADATVDAGA